MELHVRMYVPRHPLAEYTRDKLFIFINTLFLLTVLLLPNINSLQRFPINIQIKES